MKLKSHIMILALPALLLLFGSCGNDGFDLPDYYDHDAADSRVSRQIVAGAGGYIGHVKSVSETEVTRGVTLLRMGYLNQRGLAMQMFLYKVSLGAVSVRVSLPDDIQAVGALQTLVSQATAIENGGACTVWGAISGGAVSSSGQPVGILHAGGTALSASPGNTPAFFAVLNDGQAVCRPSADYLTTSPRIEEAVSGGIFLMSNGYPLTQSDTGTLARSAVGVSEDGGEVFLLVVDGSDFYYSNGITPDDMALVLKSCGAHDAMSLDSGNPVTAVWRNERLATLFEVMNKPANKGVAAEIPNGLAIVER